MKENNIIVLSSYPNNIHNSTPSPSICNKNNSILIINDKMDKIKFGQNKSFSQIYKNNKVFILKSSEKDILQFQEVSSHSSFDKFIEENIKDNGLLAGINSLIEKGVFEESSLGQESQSSSKSSIICYIIKNNDEINNQISGIINAKDEYIKDLEKKLETEIKEKKNVIELNKKLTEEIESLKKEKDILYNMINNDLLKKYEDLKEEIRQLKEEKLLEKSKNENKDQIDFEMQKLIDEMRKEFELGENFSDKKLSEVLKKSDLDKELAFSILYD